MRVWSHVLVRRESARATPWRVHANEAVERRTLGDDVAESREKAPGRLPPPNKPVLRLRAFTHTAGARLHTSTLLTHAQ
jgi:hypothetical protein